MRAIQARVKFVCFLVLGSLLGFLCAFLLLLLFSFSFYLLSLWGVNNFKMCSTHIHVVKWYSFWWLGGSRHNTYTNLETLPLIHESFKFNFINVLLC